jgi:hypothetical protein
VAAKSAALGLAGGVAKCPRQDLLPLKPHTGREVLGRHPRYVYRRLGGGCLRAGGPKSGGLRRNQRLASRRDLCRAVPGPATGAAIASGSATWGGEPVPEDCDLASGPARRNAPPSTSRQCRRAHPSYPRPRKPRPRRRPITVSSVSTPRPATTRRMQRGGDQLTNAAACRLVRVAMGTRSQGAFRVK